MWIQQLAFYAFALSAIVAATLVITGHNPVRCALALVFTFFASAGMWLLVEAEFLALILILVYVGAVMTLFLFVIMMLNIDIAEVKKRFVRYLPIGAVIVGLLVFLMIVAIRPESFGLPAKDLVMHAADYSNTKAIGLILYTEYVFPFEIAAVLLLVAIISAITLSHRPPRNCKTQPPVQQMLVRKQDRLRVVKMPSEKKPEDN